MTKSGTFITIFSLAVLVSLALTSCQAKDAAQQPASATPLAAKSVPQTKARNARSLGDMFEKMRSKIFGSRKQAASSGSSTSSQIQPAASLNAAQRQPWGDLNSFNQQYSPFSSLSSNYQWPSSSGNQYLNQQYNPLNGFINSQGVGSSAYPGLSGSQSQQGSSSLISNIDGQQQQQQQQSSLNPAANSNGANNGGLLSSASHLIAQYLSPSSSSVSSPSAQPGQLSQQMQPNGQNQNLLTPQQQTQYNEFSSILDSMVAQTGASNQRQPSLNQYLNGVSGQQNQQGIPQQQQQQQQNAQGYQSGPGNIMGAASMAGDNDMSGSSNIQSYMPASPQQASQKSSMVGLAEQLAPGSNFNKLVSFPFSLSSNEDPSKEGRYKLHIPFLNQHVKRSDQQQQVSNPAAASQKQQLQQHYLNSYYNQHQYAASSANQAQPQQQQQLMAQASQVVPTIVSPQSSISQSPSVSNAQSSPVAASAAASSSSQSAVSSSSIPQSSSSILSSANNPASVSSSIASQSNARPAWSVADLQSSSSSSKLIPMPSAASSSVDSASSSQI